MFSKPFPFFSQISTADCGPSCLKMICSFYGIHVDYPSLFKMCGTNAAGATALDITKAAKIIGLSPHSVRFTFAELLSYHTVPFIAHLDGNHYVVVLHVSNKTVRLADPAFGIVYLDPVHFNRRWTNANHQGVAIFFESPNHRTERKRNRFTLWRLFTSYYATNVKSLAITIVVVLLVVASFISIPLLLRIIIGSAGSNIIVLLATAGASFILSCLCLLSIQYYLQRVLGTIVWRIYYSFQQRLMRKVMRNSAADFEHLQAEDVHRAMAFEEHIQASMERWIPLLLFSLPMVVTLSALLVLTNYVAMIIFLSLTFLSTWADYAINVRRRNELYSKFPVSETNRLSNIGLIVHSKLKKDIDENLALDRWTHSIKDFYNLRRFRQDTSSIIKLTLRAGVQIRLFVTNAFVWLSVFYFDAPLSSAFFLGLITLWLDTGIMDLQASISHSISGNSYFKYWIESTAIFLNTNSEDNEFD